MKEKVLILGAGNWMYGDEAAGIMVANELGRRFAGTARVYHDTSRMGDDLVDPAQDTPELVVVTTVAAESQDLPAGKWRRIELCGQTDDGAQEDLENTQSPELSSLLELSQRLRGANKRVWVYAMAGCGHRLGAPLSRPVQEELESLETQIESDIKLELGMESQQQLETHSSVGPY